MTVCIYPSVPNIPLPKLDVFRHAAERLPHEQEACSVFRRSLNWLPPRYVLYLCGEGGYPRFSAMAFAAFSIISSVTIVFASCAGEGGVNLSDGVS